MSCAASRHLQCVRSARESRLQAVRLDGPRRVTPEDLSDPSLPGAGKHGVAIVAECREPGQRPPGCLDRAERQGALFPNQKEGNSPCREGAKNESCPACSSSWPETSPAYWSSCEGTSLRRRRKATSRSSWTGGRGHGGQPVSPGVADGRSCHA